MTGKELAKKCKKYNEKVFIHLGEGRLREVQKAQIREFSIYNEEGSVVSEASEKKGKRIKGVVLEC